MPWFRVDDEFYDHPKVLSIPDRHADAAISLWTRAGAWVGRSTDGHVPGYRLRSMRVARGAAEALLAAGLWHRAAELRSCASCVALYRKHAVELPPADDGYVFHQWLERNPSKAKVAEERRKTAERVAQSRARRGGSGAGDAVSDPVTDPATNAATAPATTPATNAATAPDTNTVGNAVGTPVGIAAGSGVGTAVVAPLVTPDVTPLHTPLVTPLVRLPRPDPTRPLSNDSPFVSPVTEATAREPAAAAAGTHPLEAQELCDLLAGLVATHAEPGPPPTRTPAWTSSANRLVRAHGAVVVEETLRWTQQDAWWRDVVRKMPTLAANWDQIRADMRLKASGRAAPRAGRMAKTKANHASVQAAIDALASGRPAIPGGYVDATT